MYESARRTAYSYTRSPPPSKRQCWSRPYGGAARSITAPWSSDATLNAPRVRHSERSSLPRALRCWASVSSSRFSVPLRAQLWKRRWQVWEGGSSAGNVCHWAPVRRIYRMPLVHVPAVAPRPPASVRPSRHRFQDWLKQRRLLVSHVDRRRLQEAV